MDQYNFTAVNFSFSGDLPHPSWYYSGLIPAVVLCFCFVLGVPGNIAVILLNVSRSLMLNLAISDLLCLLTLPPWIYSLLYGWSFGLVACKVLAYLVYCTIYGSQLTVTVLSIQRYLIVVRQKRLPEMKNAMLLVVLWMVAFILSIPVLVVRQLSTHQQQIVCQSQYSSEAQGVVVLLAETLFDTFSFSVIVFSYKHIHRKINRAAFFNNPQTTRLVTSIIVSFFVLRTPYHVINVLGVAAMCLKNKSLFDFCIKMWDIVKAFTFVNSWLNPLLYAFTSNIICTVCRKKEQCLGTSFLNYIYLSQDVNVRFITSVHVQCMQTLLHESVKRINKTKTPK
uniref:G-protein coupled receptors family 1 profile domain-containing protein n=1 Tax=Fundulus heteroclitus TaxID=8078 RepID=A0A3Q2P763_FUNHE